MLEILKINNRQLVPAEIDEENIWISLVNPTREEIDKIIKKFNIDEDILRDPLDQEEVSRLEVEEKETLIIINAPYEEELIDDELVYSTVPVGIIIKDNVIITISLKKISLLEKMKKYRKINADINKQTKFVFQVIYNITLEYLRYLRKIDNITNNIERKLKQSTKNEYLLQLLTLEKNLVYFLTALKSNEQVLNKIVGFKALKTYEEDEELFEDVIIELKQAQEMANISSIVIRSIRDAFASIISNNLNNIMKILASFTIILTVPTMIYSFFGMNTYMGSIAKTWVSTFIIFIISIIVSTILYKIMKNKNMF